MSNLPLGDDLKSLFDDVTSGKQGGETIRAILVQSDNGILRLIDSLPEKGTDKEDFNNVLGKLFAKEPSKSGYALYRLDSKSPAGLYEWLNCAYRPEGAKVREKMQYSITQASLFQGLNEQHFLDTVYGGTSSEFSFPTRLRNQRKHDYQNPQLSTAGKKPAEAAGTGTLGRRNFDKIPSQGALPQKATPSKEQPASPEEELVKTSSTVGVSQYFPPQAEAARMENAAPNPSQDVTDQDSLPPQVLAETDRVNREHIEDETKDDIVKGEQADVGALRDIQPDMVTPAPVDEAQTVKDVQDSLQTPAPLAAIEQTIANNKKKESQEDEEGDIMQQSIAPSSQAELTQEAIDVESQRATKIEDTSKEDVEARPSREAISSVGLGTGAEGLESEKERHLADLKSEEAKLKSSANQGGSHIGFSWQDDVEPALRGLAKKLGGTSEWNLVILKIDLANEEIQLACQPRFVPPGDLNDVLPPSEPCYAFYSHPDVQTQSEENSEVAVIYICPQNSSVRQRMLYSANLAITTTRVGEISGLNILKRIETSDAKEVTSAFLTEELLGTTSTEAAQTKAMSRPKRPGRR